MQRVLLRGEGGAGEDGRGTSMAGENGRNAVGRGCGGASLVAVRRVLRLHGRERDGAEEQVGSGRVEKPLDVSGYCLH